jgi:hypothetical protein
MLDKERELEFVRTILSTKAATLDRSEQKEVDSYNDLLNTFRSLSFGLDLIETPTAKGKGKSMVDELHNLMGKRNKVSEVSFTEKKALEDDLQNVSLRSVIK